MPTETKGNMAILHVPLLVYFWSLDSLLGPNSETLTERLLS